MIKSALGGSITKGDVGLTEKRESWYRAYKYRLSNFREILQVHLRIIYRDFINSFVCINLEDSPLC